jgi:hypothetical protein
MKMTPPSDKGMGRAVIDHDALLRGNMDRVFNERDAGRRLAAMDDVWTDNPVMYEVEEALAGRRRISDSIGMLHLKLPPGTRFSPVGKTLVNNDAAMLRWSAHGTDGVVTVTGTDVAFVRGGRIDCLYVFLDPH